VYQSLVHDVEELLYIRQDTQHSAVDSAIDGERVFAPAYGPKENILSTDNVLIEQSLRQLSNVPNSSNVFFGSVNNFQSYCKSSARICQEELVEQLRRFQTFMFHTVVQQTF